MARHHFTLAALATSALPGLEVAAAQPFSGGGTGAFDAALITSATGEHLVVRVPLSPAAAKTAAGEARALSALTPGARHRLPFDAPVVRGLLPGANGLPAAFVTTYVPGQRVRPGNVRPGGGFAASLGAAIAAVHGLPTGVVVDAGLSISSAAEVRAAVAGLVGRAAGTGRVPGLLIERWRSALDDAALWRFQPTVTHGALAAEALLSTSRGTPAEALAGVLHWADLAVGDPARDLAWALSLDEAAETVLTGYAAARRGGVDTDLHRRALLHAELELARWLLHGVDARRRDVVDDAGALLQNLVRAVEQRTAASLAHRTAPVLSVGEVERMLDDQRDLVLAHTGPVRTAQPSTVPLTTDDHRSRSSRSE
jgi:macrolide phosphotransferase